MSSLYQVVVIGKYQGQIINNTYYYYREIQNEGRNRFIDDSPNASARALLALFIELWAPVYNSISVADCVYNSLRITSIETRANRDRRFAINWPNVWGSERAVDGLPSGVAAIVTRRWGNGQRRSNGRVYYAGIANDDVADGLVQAGTLTWTAMQLAAQKMVARFSDLDYSFIPVVTNPRKEQVVGNPFPSRNVALALPVPQLATQRRRRPGHGRRG